ncbi:mitochondrial ribosomal protein subunit L20-domain-containing protein [Astrocystis sublimbata]|nr:mitochondrial ribosomal protein subunit L20-domain-containing protein [Astrocystis sublimbata]
METRQVLRPLSSLTQHATATATACSAATRAPILRSLDGRRHQSTTSRTKKMLKIPPHPDFLTPRSGENHIIFNPPSSAASVYHTPFKFLPKTDPRRQSNITQLLRSSGADLHTVAPLPPLSHPSEANEKKYHVTKEQVDEMRRLRETDPIEWSVVKLATKYDCSPVFVMMCCRASREHTDNEYERREAIKARWGPIRTKAREDRKKRRTLLLRGAL